MVTTTTASDRRAARCSRPLSRSQTTTPHPHHPPPGGPHGPGRLKPSTRVRTLGPHGLIPQNPNSVSANSHTPTQHPQEPDGPRTALSRVSRRSVSSTSLRHHPRTDLHRDTTSPCHHVSVSPRSCPAQRRHADRSGCVLLRKEVIQPHLPVRLPCYDFVPIASPTFDHSLHTRWLGRGLRVLPTFVT